MKAQYAILRFAKYKGPEIGHIESHNERTKEKYASNPDVDTSCSHLNFHLVTPERKYRAEAEKQIAEAGCRTRSDSVRVVEALVTASPEFFKGKKKSEVRAYWLCSGKIKNGADSCGSFAVYEEEIKPVLYEVFHDTKADADAMIAEYSRMYNVLTENGALPQKIEEQQKLIDLANRKKNKLLQLVADDSVTHADFKAMTAACNEEIRAAEIEIAELEQAALEGEEFRKKIEEIRKILANAQKDAASGIISKEFVDKYIDKIFVTPAEDSTLLLQIKIFTGETIEKYLRKFESRVGIITGELTEQQENPDAARVSEPCVSAGHTFKKMIESYENNLK